MKNRIMLVILVGVLAGALVLRARAALQIGLESTAVRDLDRAAGFSIKDPYVTEARQELAKLHSQAADQMQDIKANVQKICAKPLVDCKAGKDPGTFCSHDVIEQVANLKYLLRVYGGSQKVQGMEELLNKLRPLPGYKQGKDDCVKETAAGEMSWIKDDPKIDNVIKMSLEAEDFANKKSQMQMDMLQLARDQREKDPQAARQLCQKLIDEYPLSSAAS